MKAFAYEEKTIPMNLKSRLAFYKKEYRSNWKQFVKFRKGWTKYGQNTETLSTDKTKLVSGYEFFAQIGYCDEFARIDHYGWHENNEGDAGVIRGAVLKIRGAKYTQYVPAVIYSDSQSHWADLSEALKVERGESKETHEQAIRECALMADGLAEIDAEQCREANEQYAIEQDIESKREEIAYIRKEASELIKGLRASVLAPSLCENIKSQIMQLKASVSKNVCEINELKERIL